MMSAIATSAATVTPSRQPSQIAVADPATAEATARPIQMGTRGSAESPDGAGRPAGAGLPSACWPGSSGSGDDPAGSPGSGDDPAGSPGSGDDPAALGYGQVSRSTFLRVTERIRKDEAIPVPPSCWTP